MTIIALVKQKTQSRYTVLHARIPSPRMLKEKGPRKAMSDFGGPHCHTGLLLPSPLLFFLFTFHLHSTFFFWPPSSFLFSTSQLSLRCSILDISTFYTTSASRPITRPSASFHQLPPGIEGASLHWGLSKSRLPESPLTMASFKVCGQRAISGP